ncbi:NAD-dependent epimerase/dehydratase family protein [Kutzneria sp. CA-103260]|uniref:NAD-dependent epimerase/dehydratase family protein n=1 Tax=Kutzneria sp. CA-103260 TaxID=2802641 RepID=UPI001BA7E2CB|nr:NAD(P)-dependent oxidoreductase [Kutzneria sp. CA-103260]QUQ65285.1 SDR family NAD(P)-dependent oxidoreductase [Kutzneria sp. CA-103260]
MGLNGVTEWDLIDNAEQITVMITGGYGFIGRHLAMSLTLRRFRVVVVDKLDGMGRSNLDMVEQVRLDIADFGQCLAIMRTIKPQIVFHLAASSTIDAAFSDPHGSLMSNVCGTMNMLEAARIACPDLMRFILSSTDKVYGELIGEFYTESSSLEARGVYDVGKQSADTMVQLYGYELGLPVSTLRLCNVFGPGDPNTSSRIVPRSLSRLFDPAGPLPPVIYEGSMAHGRDYVYVTDVVRALVAIAFNPQARGQVFNMAPAAYRMTLDLVEELIEQSRRACEPHDRGRAEAIRRNGYEVLACGSLARELERQRCDASKLRSVLGFQNMVSMSEGLRQTIRSFMQNCGIR